MPILRYFVFVGGALIALLFAVSFAVPQEPASKTTLTTSNDPPPIRIRSDRKLPDRIVLDTDQPIVTAPAAVTMAAAPEPQPPVQDSSAGTKSDVRQSFAQVTTAEPKAEAPRKVEKPRRKVARAHPAPGRPMMLVAQQPHFAFFNTW